MKFSIIGYTGFVGSNLMNQYDFEDTYNSKNFRELQGKKYDLIVCAGVSAVKWLAIKEPAKDIQNIEVLQEVLKNVEAKKFVLISTVDVYPLSTGQNEDFDCSTLENHAYGTHRLSFEKFCAQNFSNCSILRLPGLFGSGLKKNVLYDLLNLNYLEGINLSNSFQYYNLENLWRDIQIILKENIPLINLVTEPIPTSEIHQLFFPEVEINNHGLKEVHYDLHSKFSHVWGKEGPYIYSKKEILADLSIFINNYNNKT